jgi:hypothetical protein
MYYYDFRNNSYYGGVEEVPLAPNGSYKKTFSTHMFNEGNYAVILKLPTGETVVQLRFTVEEPYIEINPFRISSNVVPLSGTTNCAAGDMLEVAVLCYSPEVQGWVRTGESQYVPVMKGTTNINRWSASFDAATLVPGVYIVKVSSASPAAAAKALFTITGQ